MKLYLFYLEVGHFEPTQLVKIIFTQNVDRAIEIFANGNEVNQKFTGSDYFTIGNGCYNIDKDVDFFIDSKYDIDKVEKLLDDLESGKHFDYVTTYEDGTVITQEDLTKLVNKCKKDFVSMVDKIVFLKEKNLFIQGLTDEQINFYYEKFAEVK